MRKLILTILAIIMLLGGNTLMAQNKIEQQIKTASASFDQGDIQTALDILQDLKNAEKITSEQKVEVYKQITICYIFLNQEDTNIDEEKKMKLAQESYLKLLKTNNIYEPDSNDIIDYIRFTNKFTSKPLFVITPYVGVNTSFIDVLQYYGTSNLSDTASYYGLNTATPYTPNFTNITAGVNLNWNIRKVFSIEFGGGYSMRSYGYRESLLYGSQPFTLSFTEKQEWVDLSAVLKFDIGRSKTLIPYIYGGVSYNLLLKSRLDFVERSFSELPIELDIIQARFNSNGSLIGGVGVKWRVFGKHYLTIDGQYGRMIRKVNNIDNRYTISPARELNYNLGYVDNDIRLNNARITIGFAYAIYNPRMKE
ncbi:MAG: hypothetical protein ACI97N_001628 [Cognaticolwellia sp.]|jgi:uncharacterized protein Smg (DUF494 family)|tara:strand:+ start:288 stop:1385 length:1098 start_codon:yes stop_codon:yes gene_type:complete